MTLDSKKIKNIYAGKVASKYDYAMPPFFIKWKKQAFEGSALKTGDKVLVFCCGTGLDFSPILEKIGTTGHIVGVDFSTEMLLAAAEKAAKNGWENVELLEADVTQFEHALCGSFDVVICTLGLSIIPDYKSAYTNLLRHLKKQGQVIIGDMQLASGWRSHLNPVTILMAKKFGGTHEGHKNSQTICALMERDLIQVQKREFFFRSYFYCRGFKAS